MNSKFDQVGSRSTYVNIQSSPCWYWHTSRRRPSNGLLHWQFWMKWMTGRWRLTCSLAKANTSLRVPTLSFGHLAPSLRYSWVYHSSGSHTQHSGGSQGPPRVHNLQLIKTQTLWFDMILTDSDCRLWVPSEGHVQCCHHLLCRTVETNFSNFARHGAGKVMKLPLAVCNVWKLYTHII